MAWNKTTIWVEVAVNDKATKQLWVFKSKLKSFSAWIWSMAWKITWWLTSWLQSLTSWLWNIATAWWVALWWLITDAAMADKIFRNLQNQLWLTKSELSWMKDIVKDLYASWLWTWIEEISNSVAKTARELWSTWDELKEQVKTISTISETFWKDYAETFEAITALTDAFWMSFKDAWNYIYKWLQQSWDLSWDFLNTISWFKWAFKDMKFSWKDTMNFLLNSVSDSTWNYWELWQAVENFMFNFQNWAEWLQTAFAALRDEQKKGMDYYKYLDDFNSWFKSWKDILWEVVKRLNEIDDQSSRMRIISNIFWWKTWKIWEEWVTWLKIFWDTLWQTSWLVEKAFTNIEESSWNSLRKLRVEFMKIWEAFLPMIESLTKFFKENPQYIQEFTTKVGEWIKSFDFNSVIEQLKNVLDLVSKIWKPLWWISDFTVSWAWFWKELWVSWLSSIWVMDEPQKWLKERLLDLNAATWWSDNTTKNLSSNNPDLWWSLASVRTMENLFWKWKWWGEWWSIININMNNNVIKWEWDENRLAKKIWDNLSRWNVLTNKGIK